MLNSEAACDGGAGSGYFRLWSSVSIGIGLSTTETISKSSNAVEEKGVSAWSKDCTHAEFRIVQMKLKVYQIRHMIPAGVQLSCSYN